MTQFPFDVVGFDLDGTLLDTSLDLGMALNHALEAAGRPTVPLDTVASLIGGGARMMLDRALAATGGPEGVDVPAMHARLIAYYEANIAVHTRLFPGGGEMLDALEESGVRLALVTNKMERLARRLLDTLGLSSRFSLILGGDSLGPGRGKPAPDLLLEMRGRLGAIRPAYVGDTTYDTLAARAAGMPCIGVRFGFNDVPAEDLGADALIGHFDDLLPALRQVAVPAD